MSAFFRAKLSARMLLAVFLPMLVLSSFHVHVYAESATADCYECSHHLRHAGHIAPATAFMHDCVLCQLFQLSYLPPLVLSAGLLTAVVCRLLFGYPTAQTAPSEGCPRLRAPPARMC